MERRVVVTGLGLISPLGNDVRTNWEAAVAGRSGIGPITKFDPSRLATHFAGEVRNFDPATVMDPKEVRRYDTFIHYALAAAIEAVADSGLSFDGELAERTGVVFGSGMGGLEAIEENSLILRERGPRRISPFFVPRCIINSAPGLISMRFGLHGPNYGTVSACASAGHAIADAMHIIRRGDADVMITGGSEATIMELAFAGFNSAKALSTRNDDPQGASRPFDVDRDGFVMSEGGGALVLEELEHAKRRGARIYAELAGAGMSGDAYHITAPHPEGKGAALAMRGALRSAGLNPEDVGYINAHATSTDLGDVQESKAIEEVFGDHAFKLAVSGTKSMHGHLLGAAGAIEAILTVLSLYHQVMLPTINLHNVDPECRLDYVPNEAREVRGLKAALSNNFGFGGTNVCLAFRRFD
ncbi:3-oxoacyl-[acyl-carrier-protein] synthase II [Symbiobacterium terraclitae]|jgi:3-oxoacyl-[acyl-carrier-protein] synthase II|uniref:3-oxoacyl-[acyl-carrier-protein] synthase 2 n=1 Tax=Symbiobacterium terraclitae TaxID=557451 RepID=A0ABS4JVJ6_9FIRM|nr:beta-ketoacyl-ACP synthase II [Symbiobacterium terraclitae]MBP2019524.1 3-oxoacyl-[acyl-carrier-protein] synthase II [Symbiobacterium terraclitae]